MRLPAIQLSKELPMTSRMIRPPAALAVPLIEAKSNLRIDDDDSDLLVQMWIKGITRHAQAHTNRAFVHQGWKLTLDGFPDSIELPMSPLASVDVIRFIDAAGQTQTLDPRDYLVDLESEPGYVVPAPGRAWPETADQVNAVSIEYTCGYGVSDAAVPDDIKLYVLAKLTEQFDPAVRMEKLTVQSSYIDCLLQPYRVYL
jgi:uncharacterized phiE125 gp8 family phage protein